MDAPMLPAGAAETRVRRRNAVADGGYGRLRGEINRLQDRFLAVPAPIGTADRLRPAPFVRPGVPSAAA